MEVKGRGGGGVEIITIRHNEQKVFHSIKLELLNAFKIALKCYKMLFFFIQNLYGNGLKNA